MTELKRYVSHKELQAKPMTRKEYCDYRGWNLPEDENRDDVGMFMVYENGYETWSPKNQFDAGHADASCPLTRLITEKNQLEIKAKLLSGALENKSIMINIPQKQRELMGKQYVGMTRYLSILNERIEFWEVK